MKVMLVVNEFPPERVRGTAMATASLADALAARGVTVDVVVTTRATAPALERRGGVTVHRLRTLGMPWTRSAQRAFGVLRLARALRPDVVQGQAISCGLFAVLAGRALGVPSVTYVQGMDHAEAGPLQRRLEVRPAVRGAARTLAVTRALADRVARECGRPVTVVPHGYQREAVGAEALDAARRRLKGGHPSLLYVGFLEPDKGAHVAVAALPLLRGEWPAVRLHVVGDGPLRPALEAAAARAGTSQHLVLHGALPHADVVALMRTSDVLLAPSVANEPFGIATIEALGEGCPVVASEACGTAEVVAGSGGGLVVPVADPASLAAATSSILADPGRRPAMAEAARRTGAAFAWERNVERFERVYRQLVEPRR